MKWKRPLNNCKMNILMKHILITLVILGLIATVIVLSVSLFLKKSPTEEKPPEQSGYAYNAPTSTPTPFPVTANTPNPTQAPTVASVVFFDGTTFTDAEKVILNSKISEPFLDYYRDQYNAGYVNKLTFKKNTQANKVDFPYLADYEMDGGVTGGFVVSKKGNSVDWWYPECLNGCNFSQSFAQKYPEIVAKTK